MIIWLSALDGESREFHGHFKRVQPLKFDFWAKFAKRLVRNDFFSIELIFVGNLYSTNVVKVFFAGITILCRRDRANKNAKNISKSQMAPGRRSSSVRVNKGKTPLWWNLRGYLNRHDVIIVITRNYHAFDDIIKYFSYDKIYVMLL